MCTINDCVQPVLAKNMCQKHYYRKKRGHDPTKPTRFTRRYAILKKDVALIPLGINAKDGYAIVDIQNKELDSSQWCISVRGYPVTGKGKKITNLHHTIIGKPPKGLVTDHINRDKLDNRRDNLRFVTQKTNILNSDNPVTLFWN